MAWVEAVASSLTELFPPDLMTERLAAFERFYPWIDRDGLAYFRARLDQVGVVAVRSTSTSVATTWPSGIPPVSVMREDWAG